MLDIKKISPLQKIILASLALHLIAACFSSGFHHFDEHFQIYEFLNFKLGKTPAENLPWEFHYMARPWIQVYLYKAIYHLNELFGISTPFLHALVFRISSSLLGLLSLISLWPIIKRWFKDESLQLIAFFLLNFSWFVPYIQTRTNAESVSSSFFILGFSLFLQLEIKRAPLLAFLSGLLLGLSYMCRYQLALMVMFLWLWGLFFSKISKKDISLVAIAIAICIVGSVLIDYAGYGRWSFGPYQLFFTNFTEKRLENSGETPFWYYFRLALLRGIPPISIPLLLSTAIGWFVFWRHPLTWATVPLIVFHSLIGHKELRYIFPVILFAPLYFSLFIEKYIDAAKKIPRWIYISFFSINVIILVISITRRANPAVELYESIWKNPTITELHHEINNSPFRMVGLPITFYKKDNLTLIPHQHADELFNLKGDNFIFLHKGELYKKMSENKNCELLYSSYPLWTLKYNIKNWVERSRIWTLYRCSDSRLSI